VDPGTEAQAEAQDLKYLKILNAVFMALGAVLALVLGVVSLLYLTHLDMEPRLHGEMVFVATLGTVCLTVAVAAAVAFLGVYRRAGWWWAAQGGFTGVAVVAAIFGWQVLSA
jgi:uncharacterized membrane protein HdeD (DUF308 family)